MAAGGEARDSKFIPQCALDDPNLRQEGECRDVSIFVTMLINISNYLFGFIGALALLFFVYGGFVLILSQGNSEKVKKGFEIMSAAAIGLVVAFGAYVLVKFLGDSLVKKEFQLK